MDRDDLMQDFATIIASFCSRLYSRKRAKHQTEKLIRSLNREKSNEELVQLYVTPSI